MKKAYTLPLIALLLLLPLLSQAQGWMRFFDQYTFQMAQQIAATDNGVVVCGQFDDPLDSNTVSYIMALDSMGNQLWFTAVSTIYPGTGIIDMEVLSNGNIVLAGAANINPDSSYFDAAIFTYSSNGTYIGSKILGPYGFNINQMLRLPNDELILAGTFRVYGVHSAEYDAAFYHVSSTGDSINLHIMQDVDTLDVENVRIALGHNNTLIAAFSTNRQFSTGSNLRTRLVNLDMSLNELWVKDHLYPYVAFQSQDVLATSDGGYLISAPWYFLDTTSGEYYMRATLLKTDGSGNQLWNKKYHSYATETILCATIENNQGEYVVAASGYTAVNNYETSYDARLYLMFIDANGELLRKKVYPKRTAIDMITGSEMVLLPDGGYGICGYWGSYFEQSDASVVIRTDSLGNVYTGTLMGQVFVDDNENCQADTLEPRLNAWPVLLMGADTFYTLTDPNGYFEMDVDTGTYVIQAILPSMYWKNDTACNQQTILIPPTIDTVYQDLALFADIDCPDMQVNIDAPFLRWCLPGPAYRVSYCNNGTVAATNAYIEVTLHPDLVLDTASIPYVAFGSNQYRFDVGTVDITRCGSFEMFIRVDCAVQGMGSSYCVEALAYPDTICMPPSPLWDGAKLQLEKECNTDSLQFRIINTGSTMVAPRVFTIIQDDVMYANGSYRLNAGQTLTRMVPANGATWTLITQQTPYFPGNQYLIKSVEACGTNSIGTFSRGIANMFPQTSPYPNQAEYCLVSRASLDPNDKTPTPLGLGLEGLIEADQNLRYRIRFQNTGTDTAFTVIIRDTISNKLDLLSIRNVTSSHTVKWRVLPDRSLEFLFKAILLPDSTTNELESHGYVAFDIDLVDSLPLGTEIRNTAHIYFDANVAVVTNTTLNTIGELFKTWLSVSEISDPDNRIVCYPNPTQGLLNIDVSGAVSYPLTFRLFDLSGRLVNEQLLPAINSVQIQLNPKPGMYLYEISDANGLISIGKILAY